VRRTLPFGLPSRPIADTARFEQRFQQFLQDRMRSLFNARNFRVSRCVEVAPTNTFQSRWLTNAPGRPFTHRSVAQSCPLGKASVPTATTTANLGEPFHEGGWSHDRFPPLRRRRNAPVVRHHTGPQLLPPSPLFGLA